MNRFHQYIMQNFYVGEPLQKGSLVYINRAGHYTDTKTNLPAGITLQDIVNIDQTKQHLNFCKDETLVGGVVSICTIGIVIMEHKLDKRQKGQLQVGSKLYWNTKTKRINLRKNRNNTFFGIAIKSEENGFVETKLCL